MTEITPAVPIDVRRHERPQIPREQELRHAAREFETVFLSEMLKHAGVGRMPGAFNGGPGEAAFADMLTQEYAREIARSDRFGLAEQVFEAMRGMDR